MKTMRISQCHIAGVGITEISSHDLDKFAISAASKALLDAGITYDNVDATFICFLQDWRIPTSCLDVFGRRGAPVFRISNDSGLAIATQSIRSRQSDSTLLFAIDTDEEQSRIWLVGLVLVSDLFLTSHAYLKDSAIQIRGLSHASSIYSQSLSGPDLSRTVRTATDAAFGQANIMPKDIQIVDVRHGNKQNAKPALSGLDIVPQMLSGPQSSLVGITGFVALCGLLWRLRGWTPGLPAGSQNCLQVIVRSDGSVVSAVLQRSDGRPALAWDEVRNVRDGRERLGYNPASEQRDISREDLSQVMTNAHFAPLKGPGEQLGLGAKGGDRAALARL